MSYEDIEDLIRISREHVRRRLKQPLEGDVNSPATYFGELHEEIDEAMVEVRRDNVVHLEDELGDILWDYCLLLSYLESQEYIDSIEGVLSHALEKYKEREPGMKAQSDQLWNEIKTKQKKDLIQRHASRYSGV